MRPGSACAAWLRNRRVRWKGAQRVRRLRFACTRKDRGRFLPWYRKAILELQRLQQFVRVARARGCGEAEVRVPRPAAWQFARRDRQEQRECPQRRRTGVPGNSRVDLRDVYGVRGTRRASPL